MAKQRKPDAPPRPTYLYSVPDASGNLQYVEAYSKADALAFVYPVEVKRLSAADAVKLSKLPAGTIKSAIPQTNHELPLASAPTIDALPDAPPVGDAANTEAPVSPRRAARGG